MEFCVDNFYSITLKMLFHCQNVKVLHKPNKLPCGIECAVINTTIFKEALFWWERLTNQKKTINDWLSLNLHECPFNI